MTGRVHFSRVSPNIEYKLGVRRRRRAEQDRILRRSARRRSQRFNPQQPAYQALKAKLAELRDGRQPTPGHAFANGPVLRLCPRQRGTGDIMMTDPRVPTLRERLGLAAEPNLNYDHALADAVGKFQKAHGLQPTGQLNGATIDALNGPSRGKRIDAILATHGALALDAARARQARHVMLNIPDYHLRVYQQRRARSGRPASWSASRPRRRRS